MQMNEQTAIENIDSKRQTLTLNANTKRQQQTATSNANIRLQLASWVNQDSKHRQTGSSLDQVA